MSQRVLDMIERLPRGAGVGLRHALWDETLANAEAIDFVEITVDDFIDYPARDVRQWFEPVRERFGVVAHGIGLSLGSADGLDEEYLGKVGRLLDLLEIDVYTEHLSWRRARDIMVGQFMPTPFTRAWVERVAANVLRAQHVLGRPMALENVTYLIGAPEQGLTEPVFISQVLEAADCGLLLDVTNLLINAANLGYDPEWWLANVPMERVALAHLAGGHLDDGAGLHIDSHGFVVPPEVLDTLGVIASRAPLRAALIERDKNWPRIDELVGELEHVRAALAGRRDHACVRALESPAGAAEQVDPARVEPDQISAESLQRAQAMLFEEPGLAENLRASGELPEVIARATPPHEHDALADYFLAFPVRRWRVFDKILRTKRRENIEAVLPGTCRALRDAKMMRPLITEYYQASPDQSQTLADDGMGFADYLLADPRISGALRALVEHERVVIELRRSPWRPWRLLSQRRRRRVHYHPRELDAFSHGQSERLPERLSRPIIVSYSRRPKGVWISTRSVIM